MLLNLCKQRLEHELVAIWMIKPTPHFYLFNVIKVLFLVALAVALSWSKCALHIQAWGKENNGIGDQHYWQSHCKPHVQWNGLKCTIFSCLSISKFWARNWQGKCAAKLQLKAAANPSSPSLSNFPRWCWGSNLWSRMPTNKSKSGQTYLKKSCRADDVATLNVFWKRIWRMRRRRNSMI